MSKVLVIDDDLDICSLLKRFLTKNDFETETAHTGLSGLKLIEKTKFDVVLCDFRLPDKDGIEMVQEIKRISPSSQIIVITGYSDVKMAVKVIKRGAFEYVTKPIHPEEILLSINHALSEKKESFTSARVEHKEEKKAPSQQAPEFIKGKSERSKQLYQLMDLVAPTNMTVIVLGESGTGKEVMANAIHNNSKRKNKKFVSVDCGAIPKEIAGSELFGHKKGSFTGALADKIGHFEEAHGGTLFLDEIGNLSYENQVKLLRVLQERKIKRIGDLVEIPVDVRIIVATNEDLKDMVAKGTFREDLYYRINEFKLELTALRERKTEIPEFANHLLNRAIHDLNKAEDLKLNDEVIEVFKTYPWPGNLREMKNVIKRAALVSTSKEISLDNIPEEIKNPNYFQSSQEAGSQEQAGSLKEIVEQAERRAIVDVLVKTGNNKSKTAKILGVDRKTLYNKMNSYDITLE